jgi:hypothetical protein
MPYIHPINTQTMKTKYRYILILIVIALFAVMFWKYTFRKSETSVSEQKAEIEMKASELVQDYEMNENAANQKYIGKIILVSGIVNSIDTDSLSISVVLKESSATAGVMCSFDKNNLDVTRIKPGTSVNIKGVCTGYLMDVVMNKCSLEAGNKD